MRKVFVTTIGAIVDGKPLGSVIEMDESQAHSLEKLGYVRLNPDIKTEQSAEVAAVVEQVKKESAPKKPAPRAKTKTVSKDIK